MIGEYMNKRLGLILMAFVGVVLIAPDLLAAGGASEEIDALKTELESDVKSTQGVLGIIISFIISMIPLGLGIYAGTEEYKKSKQENAQDRDASSRTTMQVLKVVAVTYIKVLLIITIAVAALTGDFGKGWDTSTKFWNVVLPG
jgi:amino acid transporter